MNHRCLLALLWLLPLTATAQDRINQPNIKTLVTMVNQNWLNAPVMRLNGDDVLTVEFDELSHDYHRYVYRLEHCEADWTPSEELFESDWLSGFNNNPIDDYAHSINTIVPYTHYQLQLPNDRCQLLMSGNYRLYVLDEDDDNREVLVTQFMVTEQSMRLSLSSTPNTDIDTRQSHSFLGLPVPSNALIWVGLALAGFASENLTGGIILAVIAMITNILMVSEMPMFSLKVNFKDMSWKSNAVQYIFLIGCAALIVASRQWYALSLIILWYIVLSAITQRKHAE